MKSTKYNASILYMNVKINPDFRLCKFSCKTERFDHIKPKMKMYGRVILESISTYWNWENSNTTSKMVWFHCMASAHTSVSAGVDNPQESSHLGEEALHYSTELRTSIWVYFRTTVCWKGSPMEFFTFNQLENSLPVEIIQLFCDW